MNKPVRVVIVGAGYVSKYHIQAVKSLLHAEIVAIVDVNKDQASQVAAQFGIPQICARLAETKSLNPNVVHILTPPSSHKNLTIEALEMGCHVFVEKPMAETASDCEEMIRKSQECGLTLSVNHSARFDPVILDALHRVRRGDLGDVIHVEFIRSSEYTPYGGGPLPPPYRSGAYPFQDLGVHGLYLLEAFLGQLTEVRPRYFGSGRDLWLTFDEWRCDVVGARGTGHMMLSWNNRPVQNEIVVHGTKGVLRAECFLQVCTVRKLWPGPKPAQWVLNGITTSLRTLWQVPLNTLRFASGRLKASPGIHQGVLEFHHALQRNKPAPVPAEEGLRMVSHLEEVSRKADADKVAARAAQFRPLAPAPIVVTGANGFLGRALLRRLIEEGAPLPIRVFVRRPVPELSQDARFQCVIGDLGDQAMIDHAISGTETVFHIGATMKGGTEDFERGTVWGTRHVVESCLKHSVKKLVYVSSLSVLDHAGHPVGTAVTEASALEPHPEQRGAYTQTKLKAEQIVVDAIRNNNLPAVVIRPGQIFGPGSEGVAPSGVIGLAGRWLVVGSGSRNLPLVFVDDVAEALVSAYKSPEAEGQVIQIVDPAPVTQRDYIQAAKRVRPVKAIFVPVPLMMLLAFGVELLGKILKRGVPLTKYRVRSIFPLGPFDLTAAATKLGWKPKVGSMEGLRRTFSARPSPNTEL